MKKVKQRKGSAAVKGHGCKQVVLWSALVLVITAAAIRWLSLYFEQQEVAARINVMDWQYNKSNPHHMTNWLAAYGRPAVLHNTPFNLWKSAQWTPQKLRDDPRINQILSKKGQDNVFRYFAADQPLSKHKQFESPKPFVEVIYSRVSFFDLLQQAHDGYYYYSSGGIELLNMKEVYSREQLELLTFVPLTESDEKQLGQVNFWFGKENVTAYTHYDTSYNLHAVVCGRKRFILFPPEAYRHLALYPFLHQFYRQTHTDVLGGDYSTILSKLNGVNVILSPGEVLYIPPYWFHCVITLETTISLNVWSKSEALLIMEEVYSLPLPFEEVWGKEKLMQVLVYFLTTLAGKVCESKRMILETVFQRYEPLLSSFIAEENEEFLFVVKSYCPCSLITDILKPEEVQHIDNRILEIDTLLQLVTPSTVREMNFGNYVELTALRILGSDNIVLLPFYLRECFVQ